MSTDGTVPEPTVVCHLGTLLDEREMTLVELSSRTQITAANLSVLKNGRARAIRFSTLIAICEALNCQPGDLLSVPSATERRHVRAETSESEH